MLVWCAILFLIGVAAFLDSLFNYGEIFRQVNSVFFLLAGNSGSDNYQDEIGSVGADVSADR
jgi:phage-related holin